MGHQADHSPHGRGHSPARQSAGDAGAGSKLKSLYTFTRQLMANPRVTGAACPSSRKLARQMASFVPVHDSGLIVELGAGTGVVTAALLEKGISAGQIVAVEYSEQMAVFLRDRFPGLHVICGDASFLIDLLKNRLGDGHPAVDSVVSSLPLRSLPLAMVRAIVHQLDHLLGEEGRYIQFTYDLRPNTPCLLPGFIRCASRIIWPNIPPARVDLFRRKTASH